jgi:hypothetical protein
MITKEKAIAAYKNASVLARALDICPQAVYQWEDGKPIPRLQEMRLRYELKPRAFRIKNKGNHGE